MLIDADRTSTIEEEPELNNDESESEVDSTSAKSFWASYQWPLIVFNLLFIALVIIIIVLIVHYRSGLFNQPERFSELYFSDPATLVHKVLPDDSISLSFKIHNLEGHAQNYTYQVKFLDAANPASVTMLASDSIRVEDDAIQQVTVIFTLAKKDTQGKIQVHLVETGQTIDYAVDTNSG